MKLVYTSDPHWGQNAEGNQAVEVMLAEIATLAPDQLVVAGDAAAHRLTHVQEFYAALRAAIPLVPVIITWGNHDFWDSTFTESLQQRKAGLQGVLEAYSLHSLDLEPYGAPGLSMAGFMGWYGGRCATKDEGLIPNYLDFEPEQRSSTSRQFLEAICHLEQAPGENLKVMVSHFGINLLSESEWGLSRRWLDFIDHKGVWISGHSHKRVDVRVPGDRIRLLNCGSDYGSPRYGVLDY